jgi:hypothetical protein
MAGMNELLAYRGIFLRNSWLVQLTPPLLRYCFSYARAYFRYFSNARALRRNNLVKNACKGDVVYILGNGPSLNNFPLETVFGTDVITMNYFHLHPRLKDFNIVAHCIGEPFEAPSWADPTEMVTKTGARAYWFNLGARDFCEKEYGDKELHYYLPGVPAGFDVLGGADLCRPTLQYQSTSQMAIMVAMHMGYKKIYLLGFDHDWLATRGYSPHFYKEDDDDPTVPKADFSAIPYLTMINITKNLFEVYEAIRRIAVRQDVRIVNLSRPSYLDIFPTRDQ